jgi:hypothetical protein
MIVAGTQGIDGLEEKESRHLFGSKERTGVIG